MAIDHVKLSKTMAHALRHAPEEYGLTLDEQGWVDLGDFLRALRSRRRAWKDLSAEDLEDVLAKSKKKRFEIVQGRVRALYAHSLEKRIEKDPAEPPEYLYHGTPPRFVEAIEREGLRPMDRQYVHLSVDTDTARTVGRRRSPDPVILRVRALEAHQDGVLFYIGHSEIWLADPIPARYLERLEDAP